MDVDVAAIARLVAWGGFVVGIAFGALAARTNFCTMGAISDVVVMGDWTRLRMWLLAIAVAMIGANALDAAGVFRLGASFYTLPNVVWLSNLAGGLLFGFGMVLGSGCGSKTLVRVGGGNLKSLVVLVFLAISAYMTLRGAFAPVRIGLVDAVAVKLATNQDLPTLLAGALGAGRPAMLAIVLALVAGGLLAFVFARPEGRSGDVLLGGIGIGLVVIAGWYVTGHLGFVEEHPDTLKEAFVATNSGRIESITFVAPPAYGLELLMLWTDASRIVSFGIASVAGVLAGSFAYAMATRTFRLESFRDAEDLLNHVAAGVLMGAGGVTALGCTIGQGLTGLSTLALGSFIAFGGIVAGAVAGLRYQAWRAGRAAVAGAPARAVN